MSGEFSDQMGSSLLDDWKLRGQAAGRQDSPLEKYANFLLTPIEGQPDLSWTRWSVRRQAQFSGSRTVVRRFFQRHKITFKKKPERGGAAARRLRSACARVRVEPGFAWKEYRAGVYRDLGAVTAAGVAGRSIISFVANNVQHRVRSLNKHFVSCVRKVHSATEL